MPGGDPSTPQSSGSNSSPRGSGAVPSPWLGIPLGDYEAHMALPGVGQAALLSDVLADALRRHRPRSLAVIGCAGGNGFERIDPAVTPRVVGVDLNPAYVAAVRERHGRRIPRLELIAGDIQEAAVTFAPVECAYAGLLFEYVAAARTLGRLADLLVPGGVLVAVLQLPRFDQPEVTPSRFASLGALAGGMRLVPPADLERAAAQVGFERIAAATVASAGGKEFAVREFRRV